MQSGVPHITVKSMILAPSVTHLHTSVTICLHLSDRQHIVLSRYHIVSVCPAHIVIMSSQCAIPYETKGRVASSVNGRTPRNTRFLSSCVHLQWSQAKASLNES